VKTALQQRNIAQQCRCIGKIYIDDINHKMPSVKSNLPVTMLNLETLHFLHNNSMNAPSLQ